MATLRQTNRSLAILALAAGVLVGCSGSRKPSPAQIAACDALARSLAAQDDAFVARVKAIREQHLSLHEYDRLMIEAINQRRDAIQATTLPELSVTEEVAGCSGQPLDDLRRKAHTEMLNLRSYLNDFHRAIKSDPADVFIDQSRP